MTAEQRSTITSRVVVGIIVVGVGMAFLFDNLGWVQAGDVLRYWPFALIAVGLVKLMQDRDRSGRMLGGMLLLFGGLSAIDTFYLHDVNIFRWWPLVIVGFGVLIVLKAFGHDTGVVAEVNLARSQWDASRSRDSRPADTARPGSMSQTMNEVAIWSGVNRRVSTPNFKRAYLTAIMGGIEFDLRQAGADQGEAVIEVFVMWGGIEIKVPPDWAVSNEITPIMGGAEDQSTGTQQSRNRLVVKGVVLMGGVDIKT